MGKIEQYQSGFNDGIAHAYRLVMESGIKNLGDYVRIRGALNNIPLKMSPREYEEATEATKILLSDTMDIVWYCILADKFGFGEKRLKRARKEIYKYTAYLNRGWIYWMDVVDELNSRFKMDITLSDKDSPNWEKYKRPDAEDIYADEEYIDTAEWQHILSLAKLSEKDGIIFDQDGNEVTSYDNEYEKIEAYDFIRGLLYAKGIKIEAH